MVSSEGVKTMENLTSIVSRRAWTSSQERAMSSCSPYFYENEEKCLKNLFAFDIV